MGWKGKIIPIALGVAVFFAGLSTQFTDLSNIPIAILLLMAGLLLLGQVTWNKLINSKFDEGDIISGVALVLGALTIIAAIPVLLSVQVWPWLSMLVPWAVGIVGVVIIVQGARN